MPPVHSYRDLQVWQKAFALAGDCCRLADAMRRGGHAGLATQIERAAASVPANIAEGNGRNHRGEYLHHLSIAHGSLSELESHLMLAEAVGYADTDRLNRAISLAREVGRMLGGLIRALRRTPADRR